MYAIRSYYADLAMLAANRDIITPVDDETGTEGQEELWPTFREALLGALAECQQMRQSEGETLQKDLFARLSDFTEKIDVIEQSLPQIIAARKNSLKERLDNLLSGVDIDPVRLAQEVAIRITSYNVCYTKLLRFRTSPAYLL